MMKVIHHIFVLTLACIVLICEPSRAEDPGGVGDILSLEMRDESGHAATLGDYADYTRLVFFGFTSCMHICPMTLTNVSGALKALGPLADNVRVIFISVDPKRDTPEVLTAYTDSFHSSVVGITGSYDQIAAMTTALRTTFGYSLKADGKSRPLTREEYLEIDPAASYVPVHSSQIYVLADNGDVADIIGYGSKSTDIESILRPHLE